MCLNFLAKRTSKPHYYALFFAALLWAQGASAYVKFSNKPVEDWGDLFVQSGSEKYYTVQNGDSLYDISRVLFGDPDFWPKIWSLNSKITNPHIIEKGQVIYFVGGTGYRAPLIGMNILRPESYTYGNHFLSPEIPPAEISKGPIQLPPSLPNVLRGTDFGDEVRKVQEIETKVRAARNALRVVEITSEVTQSSPVSVGKLNRVFSGARYAVTGDLVYLKVFSGVEIGDELAIYRMRRNWLSQLKIFKFKADMVEWLGKVKIVSTAENGYVARVTHANDILQVGLNLTLKKMKSIDLPNSVDRSLLPASVSTKATIIGAHKTSGANVVGENQIVYLNNGSKAGVLEGQVYPLYSNFGDVGISKPKGFVPKRIGYVKIASVESSVATGVAFNLISEVQTGQTIGL